MLPPSMRELLFLLPHLFTPAFGAQPEAPSPIPAPLRELPWGQLNFLHTTDVHGWFGGHLQEASYGADWGDYVSFAAHLRNRTDKDGTDLLVIDTGDRIEGNGLTDASEPKAKYTYEVVKEQTLDIIVAGNHELYKTNSSEGEFNFTVPNFKDNYLASNLDILNPKTGSFEPLSRRYKKIVTKNQGIRILAFGFIYDFTGNSNNTVIKPVEDAVKEDWFQSAIRDPEVDLILVTGHVAIRSKEYDAIFKAIRSVQWDTPIQFLGGHTHIRDFKQYDSKSTALESGRYMETIGFLSISGLNGGGKVDGVTAWKTPTFSRRYIDNNQFSLQHHSGTDDKTFGTTSGQNATDLIHAARKRMGLNKIYGCAPQDYWVSRVPYSHDQSIFTWLKNDVLSKQFSNSSRASGGHPALVITNTGAIRFDIFKGPFTKDTTFLVSPFTSGFNYIPDVPYAKAKKLIQLLNNEGPIQMDTESMAGRRHRPRLAPEQPTSDLVDAAQEERAQLMRRFMKHPANANDQVPLNSENDKPELIPGYTTHDDAGTDGDDTLHSEIKFYNVPNCIQAAIGFESSAPLVSPEFDTMDASEVVLGEDPDTVDVVYNEFLENWILLGLEYLGLKYSTDDIVPRYVNGSMTDVLTQWVSENWKSKHEDRCE